MLQEKHINSLLWFCDSFCQTRKWYRPARVWHFCRKFISSTKKDNEQRHSVINLSQFLFTVDILGVSSRYWEADACLLLVDAAVWESQFWWISNCGFPKAPSVWHLRWILIDILSSSLPAESGLPQVFKVIPSFPQSSIKIIKCITGDHQVHIHSRNEDNKIPFYSWWFWSPRSPTKGCTNTVINTELNYQPTGSPDFKTTKGIIATPISSWLFHPCCPLYPMDIYIYIYIYTCHCIAIYT